MILTDGASLCENPFVYCKALCCEHDRKSSFVAANFVWFMPQVSGLFISYILFVRCEMKGLHVRTVVQ